MRVADSDACSACMSDDTVESPAALMEAPSLKSGFNEVDVATGGVGATRLTERFRLKNESEERLKAEWDLDRAV